MPVSLCLICAAGANAARMDPAKLDANGMRGDAIGLDRVGQVVVALASEAGEESAAAGPLRHGN